MDSHLAKLLLRLGFGGLMLTHGFPKLIKLLDGEIQFADPFGIGESASLVLTVFAEVVCSILIIVGYKTKLATIPLIMTMLVAIFLIHWQDPLKMKELALLYTFGYVSIAILGAGKYSLDKT